MGKFFLLSIGCLTLFCSPITISAQNNIDSLPKDPLYSIWESLPPVRNYDLSFLIQEDSCYDFRIVYIISLRQGYIMLAYTTINNYRVWTYVVSPKKRINADIKGKRIKKGASYKLRLHRYHLLPARAGIEYGCIVDIMLGEKTVSINENGVYTYLFTSFDIEGLYQIKEDEATNRKEKFINKELDIKNAILPFLEYISYAKQFENLFEFIDTLNIKHSLNKYGKYVWGRSPSDCIESKKRRDEWSIKHPVKKHDWTHLANIDPKKYGEIFWHMLKTDYCLPVDSQNMNRDLLYSSMKLKLLYYSEPDIYTVQVIWELPNVRKRFVTIINVQESDGKYKIIGFNKAYNGYILDAKEGNERFVPSQ